MKIAFLCGSLEPGCDGVGDYTRLLAAACTQSGHECLLIAMADRASSLERLDEGTQECMGSRLTTLRFPARMAWSSRTDAITNHLLRFQPAVTSLQFVPFSFQRRGHATHAITRGLVQVCATAAHRHVMFHELWVRGDSGSECSSVRQHAKSALRQAEGMIQRMRIRRLLSLLAPHTIHTSNSAYQQRLSRLSVRDLAPVTTLPLFGNIPIAAPSGKNAAASRELAYRQLLRPANQDTVPSSLWCNAWLCGFFGAIHEEWQPEPLFTKLQNAARVAQKPLVVISAGRLGGMGLQRWGALRARYKETITFVELGELEPLLLSRYLSVLDLGIATTPLSLLGKSGTVAAMLDHGLPIVVTRIDTVEAKIAGSESRPRGVDTLVYPLGLEFNALLASGRLPPRRAAQSQLKRITAQFLNDCGVPVSTSSGPELSSTSNALRAVSTHVLTESSV